ncbi:hypothetical protein Tco_1299914, partial [Tanacetum coccineum]
CADNMVDVNVPAPAPTRFDDQILPFESWVPIGKSNSAFTTSAFVPSIYIQQFWNTLTYVEKTRVYQFQLDEDWFILDATLLREALEITPVNQTHPFETPPLGDAIVDFVNQLGYTEEIHFVSRMAVNNLYQPWRAILSMINQCITGKTSGFDRPKYPILQMLWGIVTRTNVDHAKLMWEEFIQAIQTFFVDKANLNSPAKKNKKTKPHVIPYCQFTKLIICHLGRTHNIHQRSESPFHIAEEDLGLGNLKFVSKANVKGKMKSAPKADQSKKPVSTKKLKPASSKPAKLAPTKQSNPVKEKPSKPTSLKHVGKGKVLKKGKGKGIAPDELAAQSLLDLHKQRREVWQINSFFRVNTDSEATKILNVGKDHAQDEEVSKTLTIEGTVDFDKGQAGSDPSNILESRPLPNEDQAGLDPGKTPESRPSPDDDNKDEDQAGSDPGISRGALVGPNPEPMYDDFMATVYLNVHESLKLPIDEHVILKDPLSSSGTLSSMKNMDDTY